MTDTCLPPGLPIPVPERDGLSAPFWEGLREERHRIQRCRSCGETQWGPEWICHRCHALDPDWIEVAPRGRIYSCIRAWHPVQPALKEATPYIAVLVELAEHPGIRLIGNLLGDPQQPVEIGREVAGVFEHHSDADPPHTLLQWRMA